VNKSSSDYIQLGHKGDFFPLTSTYQVLYL